MKKQHTPGPWAVSHGYDGSMSVDTVNHVRLNLTTACKVVVADICKHEMAEHFSAEANARLIAAAPDLLEALKMVLDDPNALDGRPRTYEYVRAAIAKAIGEKA